MCVYPAEKKKKKAAFVHPNQLAAQYQDSESSEEESSEEESSEEVISQPGSKAKNMINMWNNHNVKSAGPTPTNTWVKGKNGEFVKKSVPNQLSAKEKKARDALIGKGNKKGKKAKTQKQESPPPIAKKTKGKKGAGKNVEKYGTKF